MFGDVDLLFVDHILDTVLEVKCIALIYAYIDRSKAGGLRAKSPVYLSMTVAPLL